MALSKKDDKTDPYIITIVNNNIIKEFDFSFKNKKDLFELLNNSSLIVSLENPIFEDIEKDIYFVESKENKSSLKDIAYEILKQYIKENINKDGRMLEFFEANIDLVAIG